jgi:hypothetical protein
LQALAKSAVNPKAGSFLLLFGRKVVATKGWQKREWGYAFAMSKMTRKRLGKTTLRKEVKAMTEGRHKISADDAVTLLNEYVLQPLKVLADLLTNAEPALLFADKRETLTAIGKLLSLLAEKAECILRDYSVEA